MARPISSVHVDIARLVLEVSELSMESTENPDKAIADWTRSLVRCLALRDPSLHPYGAHLLAETEEYRRADSERKRAFKSSGKTDGRQLSADSTESPPRALQSITDQIKKENITSEPSAPPVGGGAKPKAEKKNFPDDSTPMKAARFMWEYVREWAPSAKEPTPAGYQGWALDLDLMFRLDKRSPEAFNELLDWIDQRPPARDGFTWRKNILSPATLRKRWNEGKFADFLPSDLAREEYR